MQKTNIFDFLIAALKAEGSTPTGRINILVTVLSVAILIVAMTYSGVDVIVDGVLAYLGKEPLELIPSYVLTIALITTIALFITCLFIVWKMERIIDEHVQNSKRKAS